MLVSDVSNAISNSTSLLCSNLFNHIRNQQIPWYSGLPYQFKTFSTTKIPNQTTHTKCARMFVYTSNVTKSHAPSYQIGLPAQSKSIRMMKILFRILDKFLLTTVFERVQATLFFTTIYPQNWGAAKTRNLKKT
jgi:hypothetical protein